MKLEGAVALVTGGGRRLGRGISEALASAGCCLVVHYRGSREAAEATAHGLAQRGVDTLCVQADLSRPEEIEALFAAIERRFERLDILVNSAASFEQRPLQELDEQRWDAVLAVNLRAPFLCLRHALPMLTSSRRPDDAPGVVVNVADLSGIQPWPGYSHHGVSKAGLLHLTKIAARELAPAVRVNAVVPGAILPPPGMDPDGSDWARTVARVPVGRSGSPAEVGATVVFLAQNDFIVGETIVVDGGEHLLGAGHRDLTRVDERPD